MHGESQHTPSTQKALAHSAAEEHALPMGAGATHVPIEQKYPETHSLESEHDVAHAAPTHAYGAHGIPPAD